MNDTTFIYALNDPRTGECRYVGKANNPRVRERKHTFSAKTPRTHRDCWIRGLALQGLRPVLEILDEVPVSQWQFWEREYIRVFRAIGIRLTNCTDGGEGVALPGEKNPMFGVPSPMLGKQQTVEAKEKIRAALRGNKNGESNRGRVFSPETLKRMSASRAGKPWSVARRTAQEKKS